ENIPGFMPSMTMPFVTRDPKQIAGLKTGDAISFRMVVTQKDFWIENVKKIQREDVNVQNRNGRHLLLPGVKRVSKKATRCRLLALRIKMVSGFRSTHFMASRLCSHSFSRAVRCRISARACRTISKSYRRRSKGPPADLQVHVYSASRWIRN